MWGNTERDITSSSNVAMTPPWAMEGCPRTPGFSRWKRVIRSGFGFGDRVAGFLFPAASRVACDLPEGGLEGGGAIFRLRRVTQ